MISVWVMILLVTAGICHGYYPNPFNIFYVYFSISVPGSFQLKRHGSDMANNWPHVIPAFQYPAPDREDRSYSISE